MEPEISVARQLENDVGGIISGNFRRGGCGYPIADTVRFPE